MKLFRVCLLLFLFSGLVGGVFWLINRRVVVKPVDYQSTTQEVATLIPSTPSPSASPSAIPTPKPLTFAEMNQLYGPCVTLPVLMFHHVQNLTEAKGDGHLSLTVSVDFFKQDLEYLKNKGYTVVSPIELINFFDNGSALPSKPVMLTFDDGYDDNGLDMYQLLRETNSKATIFLATGLMDNAGYLSWEKIEEMDRSGLIYFGNHTWSHRNVMSQKDVVETEITTANTQLSDRNLNLEKIFAYPYGIENGQAVQILKDLGYKLAFTTKQGRVQCKKKRFDLTRIRIGNASLAAYGL